MDQAVINEGGEPIAYNQATSNLTLIQWDRVRSSCSVQAVPLHGSETVPALTRYVGVVSKPAKNGGPCRGRTYGPLIKSDESRGYLSHC